jgi:hypothetical protein
MAVCNVVVLITAVWLGDSSFDTLGIGQSSLVTDCTRLDGSRRSMGYRTRHVAS